MSGPLPRGRARPYNFTLSFTADEYEYIARLAFEMEKDRSEFIRHHLFEQGWQVDLDSLRKKHKKLPPTLRDTLSHLRSFPEPNGRRDSKKV